MTPNLSPKAQAFWDSLPSVVEDFLDEQVKDYGLESVIEDVREWLIKRTKEAKEE